MRYLIIFTVLFAFGLHRSWAQDTFYLRVRPAPVTSPTVAARAIGNLPASLAPDSTLSLRMAHRRASELADTSGFVPNRQGAWSLFASYVSTRGRDSVVLEAAVSHSRDADWSQYRPFGRIRDKKLWPPNAVEARYWLLTDVYDIRVQKDGWCFIKLSEGQLPSTDPVVLPIRITFKVN
ncbi:hypothetical protein [Niastella populi]|uniref:Uncharacterized protein n=1 Tax=Niastella populi TaxID=550983 RepID=A0A1V9FDD7_9BACT|nr:hypothetical protein [Niastella populi]OQP56312.1 hypothetical protein A4R26_25790 [Niastella populi]